jgi:NADH dehydrogenase FAD-containing subunit
VCSPRFRPSLSAKAERSHGKLGVIPVLGSTVVDVDETGVTIAHADDATRRIRPEPSSGPPA